MSAWARCQAKICHILWASDEQQGITSLCEAFLGVGVWGLWSRVGLEIHGFPHLDAAQTVRKVQETTTSIDSTYAKVILSGLSTYGHVHQLPS